MRSRSGWTGALRKWLPLCVAVFGLVAVGLGNAADNGSVAATVSAQAADAPCITVSPPSITYGTGAFSTLQNPSIRPASESMVVQSCAASGQDILAHGTNAVGTTGQWTLIDVGGSCDSGQVDQYRLSLNNNQMQTTALSTTDKNAGEVAGGGQHSFGSQLTMPCQGSSGAGETFNLSIVYTAVLQGGGGGGGTGLVINEVDYDQPGTDTTEFVEIFNPTNEAVSLATYAIVLVNGTLNTEYARYPFPNGTTLQSGEYYTLQGLPPNSVQNAGSPGVVTPDGVALVSTSSEAVVDVLSYEGSITNVSLDTNLDGVSAIYSLVEGMPTNAADNDTAPGSVIRYPNGTDTNNAAVDWTYSATPTPGTANVP